MTNHQEQNATLSLRVQHMTKEMLYLRNEVSLLRQELTSIKSAGQSKDSDLFNFMFPQMTPFGRVESLPSALDLWKFPLEILERIFNYCGLRALGRLHRVSSHFATRMESSLRELDKRLFSKLVGSIRPEDWSWMKAYGLYSNYKRIATLFPPEFKELKKHDTCKVITWDTSRGMPLDSRGVLVGTFGQTFDEFGYMHSSPLLMNDRYWQISGPLLDTWCADWSWSASSPLTPSLSELNFQRHGWPSSKSEFRLYRNYGSVSRDGPHEIWKFGETPSFHCTLPPFEGRLGIGAAAIHGSTLVTLRNIQSSPDSKPWKLECWDILESNAEVKPRWNIQLESTLRWNGGVMAVNSEFQYVDTHEILLLKVRDGSFVSRIDLDPRFCAKWFRIEFTIWHLIVTNSNGFFLYDLVQIKSQNVKHIPVTLNTQPASLVSNFSLPDTSQCDTTRFHISTNGRFLFASQMSQIRSQADVDNLFAARARVFVFDLLKRKLCCSETKNYLGNISGRGFGQEEHAWIVYGDRMDPELENLTFVFVPGQEAP